MAVGVKLAQLRKKCDLLKLNSQKYQKTNALTQIRTEDRYITSVAPYQLGHKGRTDESGNFPIWVQAYGIYIFSDEQLTYRKVQIAQTLFLYKSDPYPKKKCEQNKGKCWQQCVVFKRGSSLLNTFKRVL